MNLAYFLEERLTLIDYFFAEGTALFCETKRQIEAEEEPYIDTRIAEYADGHAFQEQWDLADAAFQLAGAAALDYLQATLHAFLHAYMEETGNQNIIPNLKKFRQKGWFLNYREFFTTYLGLDWVDSGADLDLIEHVVLTRNDFAHAGELMTRYGFQDETHAEKHPNGAFVDPTWRNFKLSSNKLTVSAKSLREAIEQVRKLCLYLESKRTLDLPSFTFEK